MKGGNNTIHFEYSIIIYSGHHSVIMQIPLYSGHSNTSNYFIKDISV